MTGRIWLVALLASVATLGSLAPAQAARCGGDFNSFVQSFSAEAIAAGVSQGVVISALGGVAARAAQQATSAIPIVMAGFCGPLGP